MNDTLEMWNDFVRGEMVTGKRTKLIVCCNCDKMSDPEHDAKIGETGDDGIIRPTYWCDRCFKECVGDE